MIGADSQEESAAALGPLAGAARGRLRWAVNSAEWQPEGEGAGREFRFLVSLIPEAEEREQVTRFIFFKDQKRALLSRLLCRRASAAVLGLSSFAGLHIARTKGRKPFLKDPRPPEHRADLDNFNFNVSHEGDWVVLASEPICVCGIDVAAPEDRRGGGKRIDLFEDFADQLTEEEWRLVQEEAAVRRPDVSSDETPGYEAFQRLWSCKEAFTKARGDGLGFRLQRAGFSFQQLEPDTGLGPAFLAAVRLDGQPVADWRFFQHRLGSSHWVTVARGPTSDVVDQVGALRQTLRRDTQSFSREAWQAELDRESPRFDEVPVGFLVPEDNMAGYVAAGGLPWRGAAASAQPRT